MAEKKEYWDSLSVYRKEIDKIPTLTKEEEVELGKIIKEGTKTEAKEARDKLLNANLKFAYSIAREHANEKNEPLKDTIQNGNMGLLMASNHYDYSLGFRFSTYAKRWIEQQIMRANDNTSRTVRLPVSLRTKHKKIKKAQELLSINNQREPTINEISDFTGFSVKDIRKIELYFLGITSLETPISEDEEISLGDTISDKSYKGYADYITEKVINDELINDIDKILNERESEVIKRHLGLLYGDCETLEEISKSLEVSTERVRQIEKKALEKIKEYIISNQDYNNS